MTAGGPPVDLGAREFAERHRWFSWLGLVVGVGMVVGGALLAVKSARDRAAMPEEPFPCACRDCPEEVWVRVTDAQWRCEAALSVGPYHYAPINAPDCDQLLLAAVDAEKACTAAAAAPAAGVISRAKGPLAETLNRPALVLWLHASPGNSLGLVVVGACFVLVGLLCVYFYRARLRARPRAP